MPILTPEKQEVIARSNSNWLKLEEGDNIIRIASEIYFSYKHRYTNKRNENKNTVCPEMTLPEQKLKCPICEMIRTGELGDSAKARLQYCCFVINRKDHNAYILENGKSIFGALYDLIQQGWDINDIDINIKRKGQGLETKYSVIQLPKSEKITDDEKSSLVEIKKTINLEQFTTPDSAENILNKFNGIEVKYDQEAIPVDNKPDKSPVSVEELPF